jgi:hypothetical protein
MRTRHLILTLALMMFFGAAQAQGLLGRVRNAVAPKQEQPANMTAQAVVANVPSLPTPEQWAANGGHAEAFKAKIAELEQKRITTPTAQVDMRQAQANQQRQRQQAEADAARQNQTLQDGADLMAMLDLSQADMQRLGTMSQQDAEVWMLKRMQEKGISMDKLTPYSEADERRDRAAEAQGDALIKAEEAQAAYTEQAEVTNSKIDEARRNAVTRIAAIPLPDFGQQIGAEGVMQGLATAEQLQSQERRNQSLKNDYRAAAYQVWHEFIVAAQGHLKFLLPYAQAADDAQAGTPQVGGNAAAIVAGQYLSITESEPQINF